MSALDDYFETVSPDDIRIRGSRVGIEQVLDRYVNAGLGPEAIAAEFPSLRLDQVYATILHYLQRPAAVGAYVDRCVEISRAAEERYDSNPLEAVIRLRSVKASAQAGERAA